VPRTPSPGPGQQLGRWRQAANRRDVFSIVSSWNPSLCDSIPVLALISLPWRVLVALARPPTRMNFAGLIRLADRPRSLGMTPQVVGKTVPIEVVEVDALTRGPLHEPPVSTTALLGDPGAADRQGIRGR